MDNIYVDLRNENNEIKKEFNNKDFVSIDDLLNKIGELKYDLINLYEEFEDFKRDVEDNYRPVSVTEQLDISDRDFM